MTFIVNVQLDLKKKGLYFKELAKLNKKFLFPKIWLISEK